MKKSIFILLSLLVLGVGMVSADLCVDSSDCPTDAACVINDVNGFKGQCIICTDSEQDTEVGYDYKVKGEISEGVDDNTGELVTNLVDTCDGVYLIEYYCPDKDLGAPHGVVYGYSSSTRVSCSSLYAGYSCSDGACTKTKVATTTYKSSNTKLGAAEYVSGNSLPWILGGVGILLLAGVGYWHFKGTKTSKRRKK
ncbi:hypothetical protein EXS74_03315 [Candidatus Woesearchaeota archaeon]|nr:hypothetical protein [Candidatus Woesearchaeota archaeon]